MAAKHARDPGKITPKRITSQKMTDDTSIADHLHSAAIHLLRYLRRQDLASGISAPQLSALSVIVFGGPVTLGQLAAAEQVQPPTMSRLIAGMAEEGLVTRRQDREDRRVVHITATAKGEAILRKGRERRVQALAERLGMLDPEERRVLEEAAALIERLVQTTKNPS